MADMAIEIYGDRSAMPFLAAENGMSVTDTLEAGTALHARDVRYNKSMQTYVRNNNVSPATDVSDDLHLGIFTIQFTQQYQ